MMICGSRVVRSAYYQDIAAICSRLTTLDSRTATAYHEGKSAIVMRFANILALTELGRPFELLPIKAVGDLRALAALPVDAVFMHSRGRVRGEVNDLVVRLPVVHVRRVVSELDALWSHGALRAGKASASAGRTAICRTHILEDAGSEDLNVVFILGVGMILRKTENRLTSAASHTRLASACAETRQQGRHSPRSRVNLHLYLCKEPRHAFPAVLEGYLRTRDLLVAGLSTRDDELDAACSGCTDIACISVCSGAVRRRYANLPLPRGRDIHPRSRNSIGGIGFGEVDAERLGEVIPVLRIAAPAVLCIGNCDGQRDWGDTGDACRGRRSVAGGCT